MLIVSVYITEGSGLYQSKTTTLFCISCHIFYGKGGLKLYYINHSQQTGNNWCYEVYSVLFLSLRTMSLYLYWGGFNKISEIITFALVHIIDHLAFLCEDQYLVMCTTINHC